MSIKSLDKILTVILLIAIITALAATVYVIVTLKKGEEFTEFYILGPGGKAADYPTDLSAGEKGEVIVGVVNHEYENVSYLFRVMLENRTIGERSFQLAHNETLEFPFMFTVEEKGRKKLEFILFEEGQGEDEGAAMPYRELHLWINVR
uniref:DUF1616 domain-containing protein n=1 Tax=Candidatus Methanophagaceae archaeon ANME-1 ERB6 TaxID=2759912 RepID=A0A7G9YYZ0_9EURY|nr:hypothetical protein HNLOENAD_00024 [Methanosarcinales archaeon ANME-1 ERB6]